MSYYKIEKYEKMDASIVRGTFRATMFTGSGCCRAEKER